MEDSFHYNLYHNYVLPTIWYSSDMFYWLLYFCAFVLKQNKQPVIVSTKQQSNGHAGLHYHNHQHCGAIRRFVRDFNYTFNCFYMFLADRLHACFGTSVVNFGVMFKLAMYTFLCCAFLKSWLNLYDIFDCSTDILSVLAR